MEKIQDIQLEQLKAQIELLEKENRELKIENYKNKAIFQHIKDAMITFDNERYLIDVNNAACEIFEAQKNELINKRLDDFFALVPLTTLSYQNEAFLIDEKSCDEIPIQLKSGKIKYVEYHAIKNISSNQNLAILYDISSQKVLKREKIINEHMIKDLYYRSLDGVIIFDENGQFIHVNRAFLRNISIKKEILLKCKLSDFIPSESFWKYEELMHKLLDEGKAKGVLPIKSQTGEEKFFEYSAASNPYSGYYMAIMRDITHKRSMEVQLQKSEERFRAIFEHALDAIIIWGVDFNIIKANQAASRMFELPLHELEKKNFREFININDSKVMQIKETFNKTGKIREELIFKMANHEWKQLEFSSKKGAIDGNNLTIFRNVSERKRMERELRESEQRFRKIFDSVMNGILLCNSSKEIVDANEAACKIIETKKEDLIGMNYQDILTQSTIYDIQELLKEIEQNGKLYGQVPIQFSNGKMKYIELSSKQNVISGHSMTIFTDITERKEMEERLRKSDTLNVVGELAAGIAHEIRNPMTALKGFIQLLQSNMKDNFSMYFDVIQSELKRIESIITEFLVLAKPQAIQYKLNHVVKIMKETIDLINAQASLHNVQIVSDLDTSIPLVYCEPNQLKQVFINMLKNAIEVMPNGGIIHVTIKSMDENSISIMIKDEGSGIPQDKLDRLGEPFYTTKDRGTGLGLMVSYKIIKEHRGKINVESTVGKGTTFLITLPKGRELERG